jgi:hypothetical protein
MRWLAGAVLAVVAGVGQAPTPSIGPAASHKADFDHDIAPLLKSRCQPCHYPGGSVYDKLPFDKPETIRKLGTKLFTRIKAEKEQQLIRDFLAQGAEAKPTS